jgi:N-acyl-D-amino-acid deacylase
MRRTPVRYDVVVRGGSVADGGGGPLFEADVAIQDGKIAAVGRALEGRGREEVDARGKLVTPGFVDVHTHYDGQVLWSDHLAPSSIHGVTSVVMGNCAVGFAPCKEGQRELLMNVMAGVEDIPEAVMTEGLNWEWETFPEYMDVLDRRRCDIDFAAQLPHAPLRVYVMGKRGADREPPRIEDLNRMTALVEEALKCGALGVTSSHTVSHRGLDGALAPTETGSEGELLALARGMRAANAGVFEYICDFPGLALGDTSDFDVMRRVAATAGRPLAFTLLQIESQGPEGWRRLLDLVEQANAAGVQIRGQVSPRAVGICYGLDLSFNPFIFRKSYREIEHLPLEQRVAALRDPARKAKILAEPSEHANMHLVWMLSLVDKMFVMEDGFDYEPPVRESIGNRAAALGVSPFELAYDSLLEKGGRAILYTPIVNFTGGNLNPSLAMMRHPNTVVALGDGGAHYGLMCDAPYPTFALTHWVRDRKGDRIPLSEMIWALTRKSAESVGLLDRGLLSPGYKADINVIDHDRLNLRPPEVRYDLPARARRMFQQADGYDATIVSGQITYRNGEATGVLPGRLIRGAKADPSGAFS